MTARIRSIPLQQALPGMVLAAPVCDVAGNGLLAVGTELTTDLLVSLQRRGVAQLQVVEEEPLGEAELALRRAAVTERLEFLFRHDKDDVLMSALHKAVLEYRLGGLK